MRQNCILPFETAYRQACNDLMSSFPVTMVSKTTFCGLLSKAWDRLVTSENIVSGFRAYGILPFHPEALPSEAYHPILLYSSRSSSTTSTGCENNQASNKNNNTDQVQPSQSVCASEPNNENSGNSISNQVVNLTDYLSTDPEVFSSICKTVAPEVSLPILENSLTLQQLECFNFCYSKCYHTENDKMFMTWKKLKEVTKAPVQLTACGLNATMSSLPDASVTNDMDLDLPVAQLTENTASAVM